MLEEKPAGNVRLPSLDEGALSFVLVLELHDAISTSIRAVQTKRKIDVNFMCYVLGVIFNTAALSRHKLSNNSALAKIAK